MVAASTLWSSNPKWEGRSDALHSGVISTDFSHTEKKTKDFLKRMEIEWFMECFDKANSFTSLQISRYLSSSCTDPIRSSELQYCRKMDTPCAIGGPAHATRSTTVRASHPGGLVVRRIQPMVSQCCWRSSPAVPKLSRLMIYLFIQPLIWHL